MTNLKCKKCGNDIHISGFFHNGALQNYNAYWFWCICDPEKDLNLKDIVITHENN